MIQKYFFYNKANYNSKETKITSMTKKSHRAPTSENLNLAGKASYCPAEAWGTLPCMIPGQPWHSGQNSFSSVS